MRGIVLVGTYRWFLKNFSYSTSKLWRLNLCQSIFLVDLKIPNKFAAMVIEDEYSHIKRAKHLPASARPKHTDSYRCDGDICFVVSGSGYWYDAHQRWLEMDRCWLRSCASTPSSLWNCTNMWSLEDERSFFSSCSWEKRVSGYLCKL